MEGRNHWADGSVFSITDTITYHDRRTIRPSVRSTNIPAGTQLLGGAYAQFSSAGSKNFDFGFRINKNSTSDGSLQISIYQLNAAGDTWESLIVQSSPIIDYNRLGNPVVRGRGYRYLRDTPLLPE